MAKPRMVKLNKKWVFIGSGALVVVLGSIFALTTFVFAKDDKTSAKNDDKKVVETVEEEVVKELQIVDINSTSRPYAVMVNNISVARPYQSGLQDAFIIYELIAEGGISRYLALFLDQTTERIGSVRSARHYFLDYALENDAIYVHHGQSPQAQADFSALGIDRVQVNNTTTGWRDKKLNVSSEHTLFTSIEKLNNGLKNIRTEREKDLLLNYSVDEIDLSKINNAQVAENVQINYSSATKNSYIYDADKKVYMRSVNGKEHKDYVTGEQYYFKNIITYKVENYTLNDAENKGRQGIDNVGSGNGYYISNGYSVPIKWEKKSRSAQTKYYYENGEELKVNDGNTFIQIQPTGQTLTIN